MKKILMLFKSRLADSPLLSLLLRGGISAALINASGACLAFLAHVLVARMLGTSGYGVYMYVLSWVVLLALPAGAGTHASVLRFVAAYRAESDWRHLQGILRYGKALALACSLLVSLMTILLTQLLVDSPPLRTAFVIGSVLLPLMTMLRVYSSALQALKKVAYAFGPEMLGRYTVLVLGVGAVYLLGSGTPPGWTALVVECAAFFACIAVSSFLLRRALPVEAYSASPAYENRKWFVMSFFLLLVGGMRLILQRFDILMLGSMISTDAAGVYSAAARVSPFIAFGLTAMNAIAAPTISELYTRGDMKRLQYLCGMVSTSAFGFAVPAFLLIAVVREPVLFLFGAGFEVGKSALLILMIGQLVNAISGPSGLLLTMTGHERPASFILGGGVLLNILLNALLIPPYGMNGAAFASAVSIAFWNLAMVWYAKRRLGIYTAFPLSLLFLTKRERKPFDNSSKGTGRHE
jgi:O-antigen/teichoic acid export membrane protein